MGHKDWFVLEGFIYETGLKRLSAAASASLAATVHGRIGAMTTIKVGHMNVKFFPSDVGAENMEWHHMHQKCHNFPGATLVLMSSTAHRLGQRYGLHFNSQLAPKLDDKGNKISHQFKDSCSSASNWKAVKRTINKAVAAHMAGGGVGGGSGSGGARGDTAARRVFQGMSTGAACPKPGGVRLDRAASCQDDGVIPFDYKVVGSDLQFTLRSGDTLKYSSTCSEEELLSLVYAADTQKGIELSLEVSATTNTSCVARMPPVPSDKVMQQLEAVDAWVGSQFFGVDICSGGEVLAVTSAPFMENKLLSQIPEYKNAYLACAAVSAMPTLDTVRDLQFSVGGRMHISKEEPLHIRFNKDQPLYISTRLTLVDWDGGQHHAEDEAANDHVLMAPYNVVVQSFNENYVEMRDAMPALKSVDEYAKVMSLVLWAQQHRARSRSSAGKAPPSNWETAQTSYCGIYASVEARMLRIAALRHHADAIPDSGSDLKTLLNRVMMLADEYTALAQAAAASKADKAEQQDICDLAAAACQVAYFIPEQESCKAAAAANMATLLELYGKDTVGELYGKDTVGEVDSKVDPEDEAATLEWQKLTRRELVMQCLASTNQTLRGHQLLGRLLAISPSTVAYAGLADWLHASTGKVKQRVLGADLLASLQEVAEYYARATGANGWDKMGQSCNTFAERVYEVHSAMRWAYEFQDFTKQAVVQKSGWFSKYYVKASTAHTDEAFVNKAVQLAVAALEVLPRTAPAAVDVVKRLDVLIDDTPVDQATRWRWRRFLRRKTYQPSRMDTQGFWQSRR